MLEKLPGVASADADKTTNSATVIYDKSVFDASSLGDRGRYQFQLREDSATAEEAPGEEGMFKEETQESSSSMIEIKDMPAGAEKKGSGKKDDDSIMPSLDGPAS